MRFLNAAKRVTRAGSHAASLLRQPTYARPGHFYSPLSTAVDAQRAIGWRDLRDVAGIDLRETEQRTLAAALAPMWQDIASVRYDPANSQYGPADAAVLHSMLRHYRPKRLLEVGSGHSTAVVLDTADRHHLDLQITCIEPYPDQLVARLGAGDIDRLELIRAGAQEVQTQVYAELRAGDVLFIDSTHVVKAGSDVVWLFLHVLPRLDPGVIVHIHDIFWPFEYPKRWLEQRRDWTELYLLRAMLTGTSTWQIEFFSSWLWIEHPEAVPVHLRADGPSSIWLSKSA